MQAALAQSQANMELARANNGRTSRLVQQGWAAAQQGDTDRLNFAAQTAAVGVARANLEAQQAQVNRLEQLTGFEHVVAPFDGVITSRQVDVGSLVTADASSGTPLFSIAHTDVLRVQVYVPQGAFFGLKDGEQAEVTVPELPDRVFQGIVARNASALQPETRTLLAEVDVNKCRRHTDRRALCDRASEGAAAKSGNLSTIPGGNLRQGWAERRGVREW
jgi:RND family efflux transporter MFP subunit